jgi:hypothetical protein
MYPNIPKIDTTDIITYYKSTEVLMKESRMKLRIKNSNGTKLFSNRTEILETDAILANAYIRNRTETNIPNINNTQNNRIF